MNPRESAEFVCRFDSNYLHINQAQLCSLKLNTATTLDEAHIKWHQYKGHPNKNHPHLIDYIFLIDSLNFSFWTDYQCTINKRRGYAALIEALNRAAQTCDIWDPNVYGKLTLHDLIQIFQTDQNVEFPMLKERHDILMTNSQVLLERFGGSAKGLLEDGQYDSMKIIKVLANNFDNFNDVATFKGETVSFMKRAQIFIADVYTAIGKADFIKNIHGLTMFADYRIPQLLQSLGVLVYSSDLQHMIEGGMLEAGGQAEVEIRAYSIKAVEMIARQLQVVPIFADFALWDYVDENAIKMPEALNIKVRTIFYYLISFCLIG